jgi:acetylornithine deacetylase/succinyl-diaminopimelate desuccinylase-like protein
VVGDVLSAIHDLNADQLADPILGASTLVATMIDVLPQTRNVIPDSAVVTIDWRILPGDDDASLIARVNEAIRTRLPLIPEGVTYEVRMASEAQRTYTGLEAKRNLLTPGFLMSDADPMILAAADAVGRRQESGSATIRPWQFATDGGWSCGVHGIPTLGFAPGEERFAHTNRERIDVEEARWGFERHPALIAAVQRAVGH